MRISRPLLAIVVSGALTGLTLIPPAQADSTVVVTKLKDMAATDAGFLATPCNDGPGHEDLSSPPVPGIHKGPAPVPSGRRTWTYTPPAGTAVGPYRFISSMVGLGAAREQVYADQTSGGSGVLVADVGEDATTEWHGIRSVPVSAAAGWSTVRIAPDTSFDWERFDSGTASGTTFSGTIAQMVNQVGLTDASGYVGVAFGCDGHAFSLDKVKLGDTGDIVTYDLEAPATTTSIKGDDSPIIAGGDPVPLTGSTRFADSGKPIDGVLLTLKARPAGTKKWRTVDSREQLFDGTTLTRPQLNVRPKVTTSYRWVLPNLDALFGSHSSPLTIKVHTGLAVKASDESVTVGTRVKITGRTVPVKRGVKVVLWHDIYRASEARTNKRGRFTLFTRPTLKGFWNVHVTIGKTPGNLPGQSRVITINVH